MNIAEALRAAASVLLVVATATPAATPWVKTVSDMTSPTGLEELTGSVSFVAEGPQGRSVMRVEGGFAARIDLKTAGVVPGEYDLLKIDLKADRGASMQVSLENYPEPGALSHWYAPAFVEGINGWRTLWIDLKRPEEVKAAGSYKGMGSEDPSRRGLRIRASVKDLGRSIQPPGRNVWVGPVRFARTTVKIDWNQRKVPLSWAKGKDLVFTYPLTVANPLDRPITAILSLRPLQANNATATLSEDRVTLEPGQTRTVTATLTLPAGVAAARPPLYCERFLALAEAEGIEDSQVTILRSSDLIPLVVIVPLDASRLRFPLLPRRKGLPAELTGFKPPFDAARRIAEQTDPADLRKALGGPIGWTRDSRAGQGLYTWGGNSAGSRFVDGLTACAFLYDFTGEQQYLHKGTAMLRAAAEVWPGHCRQWVRQPVIQISHGVFAPNTLRLGWGTGGMRSPYAYKRHGMFNDFDLLAPGMSPDDRRAIIYGFIEPVSIHMRNHTFGIGNQQDVVNYAILYGGLASQNWPLVAFAYSSDYGLLSQIQWAFDDAGLAEEGHYHTPSIRPILYATELLHALGVNRYDERLYRILHSPAADAINKPFRDDIRDFVDLYRYGGRKIRLAGEIRDGVHLPTGLTSLRWKGAEVAMNWGTQIHRSAPDRMALRIEAPPRHPLQSVGGGNYSHSALGQSIIIVDESKQHPVPAKVVGYDIEGPVQYVQATSDKHFPGSTITRTFALIGDMALVVDRCRSDRPRTWDWCLRYRGGGQTYEDVAKGVSLSFEPKEGSFTDKPGDPAAGVNYGASLKSKGHLVAATQQAWRQSNGRFVMAAEPDTRVMVFAVRAAFSAWRKERQTGVPILMARRADRKQTDFVAAFGSTAQSVTVVPVSAAGGRPADAVGVRIERTDAKAIHAIVNYGKEAPVALDALKTTACFETDFAE